MKQLGMQTSIWTKNGVPEEKSTIKVLKREEKDSHCYVLFPYTV